MKLEIKFPTGGILKWAVSRGRETLIVGFSNDPVIGKKQVGTVGLWFGKLKGDYKAKFDAAVALLSTCSSGTEVVARMEASLRTPYSQYVPKTRSKEEATRLYDEVHHMMYLQNTTGSVTKIDRIEEEFKGWKDKNAFHWQYQMEEVSEELSDLLRFKAK